MPNATYDPTRTYLVDHFCLDVHSTSYLIRGNEPLNSDGSFAYDDLRSTLKSLIDIDLTNLKLIDFSLIDNNWVE